MSTFGLNSALERRSFCKTLPGIAVGIAGMARGALTPLEAEERENDSAQKGKIYELLGNFHLARSTQDIELMMTLWEDNASLTIAGNPNSPFVGLDSIRAFFLASGSFTHHRLSLAPAFKIQIDIHGHEAFFYDECHDVQDFDQPSRFIAFDAYLAGTLHKVEQKWLFWNIFAGSANTL